MWGVILNILFVSSKGSQYRYFSAISSVISMSSSVVTLFPGFGFKLFNSGLSLQVIRKGIDFHLKRKQRKYRGVAPPFIVWQIYVLFSVVYFSLIYLKFKRRFDVGAPDVVCIWNGHRLPEMAIKAAAAGTDIKIAYFENGLLPDTTTMDFSGVNAFSSISGASLFYERYFKENECISLADTKLLARKPHKKKAHLSARLVDERYVFIPFQVNFDSQVIINSPWLNSMESFFMMLLSVVDEVDETLMFVIKEHPSDPRTYSEFYKKHPRIKFVSEDTEQLIRGAQAVITLNSSVGIEAAMLEKKVIVLGNACYSIERMMQVETSKEGLINALNGLDKHNIDLDITRAFFTYLKNDYLLPRAWQGQIDGVDQEHKLCFEKKIFEELACDE
jgi:capsular polysaccharide export protein